MANQGRLGKTKNPVKERLIGKLIQEQRQVKKLTQEQLATKSGVPYSSLIKIESGAIRNPSAKTVAKIAQALAITLDSLVATKVFVGRKSIHAIFDDVLETMVKPGTSMCINGVEESVYLRHSSKELLSYIHLLRERGIGQKILCKEGESHFLTGDHLEYRWIPREFFAPVPTYVYGNRVSIILWGPPQQSLILENEMMAEAFRRQFLFIWERAERVVRGDNSFETKTTRTGRRKGD